eukprot:SAG22_NODE_4932_length_1122_cov_1.158406_1_plen_78_part_00
MSINVVVDGGKVVEVFFNGMTRTVVRPDEANETNVSLAVKAGASLVTVLANVLANVYIEIATTSSLRAHVEEIRVRR